MERTSYSGKEGRKREREQEPRKHMMAKISGEQTRITPQSKDIREKKRRSERKQKKTMNTRMMKAGTISGTRKIEYLRSGSSRQGAGRRGRKEKENQVA